MRRRLADVSVPDLTAPLRRGFSLRGAQLQERAPALEGRGRGICWDAEAGANVEPLRRAEPSAARRAPRLSAFGN
jgi:hypothetical protein